MLSEDHVREIAERAVERFARLLRDEILGTIDLRHEGTNTGVLLAQVVDRAESRFTKGEAV